MLRPTFMGFGTARSALNASQRLLDITGQNMANVNTNGYTRQRLDLYASSLNSNNVRYNTKDVTIGNGVGVGGISQYRDKFLDIRYRRELAKTGGEEVQLDGLEDLEAVFDEIAQKGLDGQFSDFVKQLQSLTSNPSDSVIGSVVKTSASMLCQMFNNFAKQIGTIKDQQTDYLESGAVSRTNQLLKGIADLNKQIREDNINGNPSLELNDQRNMMIDELSQYMDIEVVTTPEDIGGGKKVDLVSIKVNGEDITLVDNNKHIEIGLDKSGKDMKIKVTKFMDGKVGDLDITDKISKGEIAGYLKFLNGEGEFGATGSPSDRGIGYYEGMLDKLANQFAEVLNKQNITADGADKPLFEARDGGDITAGNLKISQAWIDSNDSYITRTKVPATPGQDNSGDASNILKMISLFNKDGGTMDFKTDQNKALFTGTFQEFFAYTSTTLGLQVNDTGSAYDSYAQTLYQIDYNRSSISAVNLDEEGSNILMYSKSFNAAARLMTTLDEMLDTLVNRMGV